jgi:hypothetical protein
MNTKTTCCGSATASPCESTIAELPRYYPRQLITPDDLTLEQDYFRDRMRRHNRLLHGWGVVCGALVCPVTGTDANNVVTLAPWQVQVQPGYALGPYGDEIIIDCTRTMDLRSNGVSGATGDPCVDAPDPWCSQVTVPRIGGTLYVAVKYKQTMTRPVRVQPIGCGCNDNTCECSRWHDGYEIGILTCCPDDKAKPPEPDKLFQGEIPACPDCPPQPWVVLAAVTVDANGVITSIDNCQCRRLVASLSGFWWQCSEGDTTVNTIKPSSITAKQATSVTVNGSNLDPNATYIFGNGVLVSVDSASTSNLVKLNVTADTTALGQHMLVIMNSDCRTMTFPDAILTVTAPATPTAGMEAPVGIPVLSKPTPKNAVAKPSPAKLAKKQTSDTPEK